MLISCYKGKWIYILTKEEEILSTQKRREVAVNEIEMRLREILKELVSDSEEKLQVINSKDNINLVQDLEFDSIMILEYVVKVEGEFHVTLEYEEDMLELIWDYERLLRWLMENAKTVLP